MKRLRAHWAVPAAVLLLSLAATLSSCSNPTPPPNYDELADNDPCAASWNLRYEELLSSGCFRKRVTRAARAGCKADEVGAASTTCKVARMLGRTGRGADVGLNASHLDKALLSGCEAGDGDGCALLGRRRLDDAPDQALALFVKGCEQDSPASCLELRLYYEEHREVSTPEHLSRLITGAEFECDPDVAACHERACSHGQATSCTRFATLLQDREEADADVTRAFKAYERACAMGDEDGCGGLGRFYEQGIVVPRSYAVARQLYAWACSPENSSPCVFAGRMLAAGLGGSRDRERAETLFVNACAAGSAPGCRRAADLVVLRDATEGGDLYAKACEGGDGESCARIAHLHISGESGYERDDARIAELFHGACDAGYADGCNEGARRFEEGDGVTTDEKVSAELAAKACELGSMTHCWASADAYRFGYGVDVDRERATYLIEAAISGYKKDCARGVGRACHNAAHATAHGYPRQKRLEEAQSFLNRACERGAEDACREVAIQHVTGEIFPVDRARGLAVMTERCDAGDTYMCRRLAHELSFGAETEADLELAVERHRRNCFWRADARACAVYALHYQRGQGVAKDVDAAHRYASRGCTESADHAEGCPVATQALLRQEPDEVEDETFADLLEKLCVYESHDEACTPLGRLYETGYGVRRDTFRALSLYERVCDADEQLGAEACSRARLVRVAQSPADDEEASAENLDEACKSGDAKSCLLLARHYEFGSVEPGRFEPARVSYRRACELGNADACTVYAALAYEDGEQWGHKFHAELLWACEKGTAQMCEQWGIRVSSHRWQTGVKLRQHACSKGLEKACRALQENLEPREPASVTTEPVSSTEPVSIE